MTPTDMDRQNRINLNHSVQILRMMNDPKRWALDTRFFKPTLRGRIRGAVRRLRRKLFL